MHKYSGSLLRHSFLVVVVVGIPGVGKSTVVNLARNFLEEKGFKSLVLNYGDFMLEELSDKGIVKSRDELRRLPLRIQLIHQANAARRMIRFAERELENLGTRGVLFIDTHLLIRTSSGFWPGLPLHVASEFMPDLIALIEAEPYEIIERQKRDTSRYRGDYSDPRLIEELLELNRREALVVATLTGSSIKIIRNNEGRAEEAARELVESIISLSTTHYKV
ncbi:MAG: adenylate kinase [Sulfolobales archaeon]